MVDTLNKRKSKFKCYFLLFILFFFCNSEKACIYATMHPYTTYQFSVQLVSFSPTHTISNNFNQLNHFEFNKFKFNRYTHQKNLDNFKNFNFDVWYFCSPSEVISGNLNQLRNEFNQNLYEFQVQSNFDSFKSGERPIHTPQTSYLNKDKNSHFPSFRSESKAMPYQQQKYKNNRFF